MLRSYTDTFGGSPYAVLTIIKNARVEWIVKAVLCAYLASFVFRLHKNFTIAKFLAMISVSLLLIFLPVLPLSATLKYQDWVTKYGGLEYTVTYFALFGTVLLFSSITLYGMQR